METAAWFYMMVYVVAIPAGYLIILCSNRRIIRMDPDDKNEIISQEWHAEVIEVRTSYGSIYKDFKREFYYFEIFEMIRKITLVGVLVLLGKAAGTQIFVGVIICFFYVLLGALTKPLIKPHDQFLQYVTSVQLFGTLITGLLLRNRAFEKAQGIGTEQDDMVIDVVLTLMTIAIVVCIVTVIAFVLGGICPCLNCSRCCCKSKHNKKNRLRGSKGKIVPVSRSGNVRGKK